MSKNIKIYILVVGINVDEIIKLLKAAKSEVLEIGEAEESDLRLPFLSCRIPQLHRYYVSVDAQIFNLKIDACNHVKIYNKTAMTLDNKIMSDENSATPGTVLTLTTLILPKKNWCNLQAVAGNVRPCT